MQHNAHNICRHARARDFVAAGHAMKSYRSRKTQKPFFSPCTNAQSTFSVCFRRRAGAAHHHRFLSSALAAALLPVYMPHHPFPRGPLLPPMVASTSSRETPPPEEELDRRSSSIAALRLKAREHELKLRDLDLSS